MTDWFRSWHGAPTDAKWLLIAKRAGCVPGIVSAIWWALMDHASQSLKRGSVEDFDVETYAEFSGFQQSTVESVLTALNAKGLILNGVLISWEKRQPLREDDRAAQRKREQRNRDKQSKDNVTQRHAMSRSVTPEQNRTEQNRAEKVKECAEPSADAEAHAPPPVVTIPTNREGEEYPVTEAQADEFQEIYPGVDVRQQLRAMRGWAISNRARRKTLRGMPKFINSWLSREQDRAASKPNQRAGPAKLGFVDLPPPEDKAA